MAPPASAMLAAGAAAAAAGICNLPYITICIVLTVAFFFGCGSSVESSYKITWCCFGKLNFVYSLLWFWYLDGQNYYFIVFW